MTTLDIKPPVFLNSTPAVASVQDTQASFSVQTDEPCTVFYALLPASAAEPSGCGKAMAARLQLHMMLRLPADRVTCAVTSLGQVEIMC